MKIVNKLFLLFFFGLTEKLNSLPVGNPAEPSLLAQGVFSGDNGYLDSYSSWLCGLKSRIGFYGDYVLNRNMEIVDLDIHVKKVSISTNAAYLALCFRKYLEFFATLGQTSLKECNIFETGEPLNIKTDDNFSWSVGGRWQFFQRGCFILGLEAQHLSSRPWFKCLSLGNVINSKPNTQGCYGESQVGVGACYIYKNFVPYLAVKYSKSRWGFSDILAPGTDIKLSDLRSFKKWGCAVGASYVYENWLADLEVRFADEKAVYLNLQLSI